MQFSSKKITPKCMYLIFHLRQREETHEALLLVLRLFNVIPFFFSVSFVWTLDSARDELGKLDPVGKLD